MIERASRLPRIVIVDPSSAPTGALRAAANISQGVAGWAETRLILATSSLVDGVDLTMFAGVVRIPMRQIRRSALDLAFYGPSLLAGCIKLRRLLRNDDILIVNDFYLLHGWLVRRLGFRGRIVTWVRIDPLAFPTLLRRLWIMAARAASDEIVAVSRFIVERLRAEGVASHLVYDPIDPSLAPTSRTQACAQRIVQIANFTRGKGQNDAIAAFARVAGRFPEASLILYGGDLGLERNRIYRAELERLAKATGFGDRILFRGFVRDVGEALSSADLALVLSHRESFSLACLEASQCGLPVIATRCGGPEEIVQDDETGLLCNVGDVAAIAAAMERLLNDPADASEMGKRGAARVQELFSPGAFATALHLLLLPNR